MAQLKRYNGSSWENVGGSIAPKTTTTTSNTDTYSCNYINGLTTTITEGTGTPNSTYVGAVENNKWTRVGQIVCFSFTLTTNNTLDYTTTIFSGLPRAKNNTRFIGLWTNNNYPMRFEITDDGRMQNSWSFANPTSNQTLEGCVTYITKD